MYSLNGTTTSTAASSTIPSPATRQTNALLVINLLEVRQEKNQRIQGEAISAAEPSTGRTVLGDAAKSFYLSNTLIREDQGRKIGVGRSWAFWADEQHWTDVVDADLELSFVVGNQDRSLDEPELMDHSLAAYLTSFSSTLESAVDPRDWLNVQV